MGRAIATVSFLSLIVEISDFRKMPEVKLDATGYNREWLVDP